MARKHKKNRILSGTVLMLGVLFCCCQGGFAAIGGGRVTFTISGQVGAPMVTLKGLPNDPTSDASGFYNVTVPYGWKGMIRPYKDGWTFEPVAIQVKRMTGNLLDQNFKATEITYTISGNVGMAGVKLIGFPNEPVSDAQGNYTAVVPHGWSKQVRPFKEGYRFSPENREYSRMLTNRTNQNYVASVIQLEISGSTGQPNVLLKGFPARVRTDPRGDYKVMVKYGWTGTVVPEKEGCTFTPSDRSYETIRTDQLKQDYQTEVIQYVITGTVGTDVGGTEGVEMRGLPGQVTTDSSGYYQTQVDYGWGGTVTPFKEGYEFDPPSITVQRVLADRMRDDFKAKIKTFTISGSTGVPKVQLLGFPDNPMTGPGGVFQVKVPWGWSGEVTPMRNGYTFTPESQPIGDVKVDRRGVNFKHEIKTYRVAGTTGVGEVKLKGFPTDVMSRPDGSYSTQVAFDWQGTVIPEKEGFEFSPPSRDYDGLNADMLYESFEASLRKQIISGDIVSDRDRRPVEGVTIITEIGSNLSAMTDEKGHFELEVDYGWEGQLQPIKDGYTFKPINRPVPRVTMDTSGMGFEAKVRMLEISGSIVIDNQPVSEVLISTEPDIGKTVTDTKGQFSLPVPYGWTGEVRYEKEGFYFDPPSESYSNVTTNIRDGEPELPTTLPATGPDTTTSTPLTTTDTTPPEGTGPTDINTTPTTEIIPDANGITGILATAAASGSETTTTTPTPDPELEALRQQVKDLQEMVKKGNKVSGAASSVDEQGQERHSELLEGELVEELQNLARDFGVTIIPDPTVGGPVLVDLVDVTLEEALDTVLAGTGYSWKKTDFYYLVTSTKPTSPGFMEGSVTQRVKLSWVDAKTAINLLSPAFQPYVQGEGHSTGPVPVTTGDSSSGYSFISRAPIAATSGRTVIVTAPPNILKRIVADLKEIDKKPKHVFLDARIVVMEKGNLLNMGIEWRWPTVQAGMFRNPPLDVVSTTTNVLGGEWPWGMRIGYTADDSFTNALEMALNLMEENGEARVVANPQVMTQDGKQAKFGVITEEYYYMTPDVQNSVGFFGRAELEKVESGTVLNITPYVGDNNDINLEVAVELSDSIPRARGTDLPVVTRRQTTNTVAVKDGGTVALAGLTQNRQTIKHQRTPGLSALPIVGNLFNNNTDDESSREVAVFVTARLIPDRPGAVSAQNSQVNTPMPGSANERPGAEPPYRPTSTEDFRNELRNSLLRSRDNSRR